MLISLVIMVNKSQVQIYPQLFQLSHLLLGAWKKEEPKVYRGQSTPNLLPNDTCRYFYYWPTDPPRYNNTIRRVKSEKDGGECNVECSVVFIGGKFKDRNNNC